MKKGTKQKRALSYLIIAALVFTLSPTATFASEDGVSDMAPRVSPIEKQELVELIKSENQGFNRYIVKYKDDSFNYERLETLEIDTKIPIDLDIKLRQITKEAGFLKAKNISEVQSVLSRGINTDTREKATVVDAEVIESDKIAVFTMSSEVTEEEFIEAAYSKAGKTGIEYIQPDYLLSPDSEEGDEDGTSELPEEEVLEIEIISEEDLYEEDFEEVIVAVIDTGIDITHPMLEQYIWTNPENGFKGWDFVNDDGNVYDPTLGLDQAHGTHVAGIIKDQAIKASADVKIMPLKVFENGKAYTSDIIKAINYAEEYGAAVVNCSFGSQDENRALYEAIEQSGMLFVCAAGNNRLDLSENPSYPACYDLGNIISVASVNRDDGFSYYSNYGNNHIDIAAPGKKVLSTFPEGAMGEMSGTSMSAAMVSGAVGDILYWAPALTAPDVKDMVISTGDRLSNLQDKVAGGRRINLDNALAGQIVSSMTNIYPEDDFDPTGYDPTQSEMMKLYSSAGAVIQIAAGIAHTLILKSNGTVWAFGNNRYGQCGTGDTTEYVRLAQVIGLADVIAIAAGEDHSLAVKSNGTLWAWGKNSCGALGDGTDSHRTSPVQAIGLTNVTKAAGGEYHSLALKSDGKVWSFGDNYSGQLGDGTLIERLTPVMVSSITGVTSIAAGNYHSLAVNGSGYVYGFGANHSGQLGDGTLVNRKTPVRSGTLTGITQVAAGSSNSLSRKSDGTVWAWGNNMDGALGDGTYTDRKSPVQAKGLTGITKVGAGLWHSLAIKNDGTVWGFGSNFRYEIGQNTMGQYPTPVKMTQFSGITEVDGGMMFTLVFKNDGKVYAVGENTSGQLGDGSVFERMTPTLSSSLSGIEMVSISSENAIALQQNGSVLVWGSNWYGQLGNGDFDMGNGLPGVLSGLTGVEKVTAGNFYNLALKTSGTLWAWGGNSYGQLGDGTTKDKKGPVQVSLLNSVSDVAAGSTHSLAVKTDGTAWAWGRNNYGQLGDGTTTNRNAPVQVLTGAKAVSGGAEHSLALKADGTVWAWGRNNYGQLGDGTTTNRTSPVQVSGITGAVAVSAGDYHNLVLKNDGSVWAFGRNDSGQLGDNSTTNRSTPVQVPALTDVTWVSAGGSHSLAAGPGGMVWSWGYNNIGQLGNGGYATRKSPVQVSSPTGITAVTAGSKSSIAFAGNGAVYGWGSNQYGIVGLPNNIYYKTPIEVQTDAVLFAGHLDGVTVDTLTWTPLVYSGGIVSKLSECWFAFKVIKETQAEVTLSAANPAIKIDIFNEAMNVVSSSTVTQEWLMPGETRYIRIRYDQNSVYTQSPFTLSVVMLDEIPISAPQNISVSDLTATSAEVIWDECDGADSYELSVNGAVIDTNDSEAALTGLTPDTQYTIKVRGKNSTFTGAWSGPVVFTTLSSVQTGKSCYVALKTSNFTGPDATYTFTYNAQTLELMDFAAPGTNITIISESAGSVTFSVIRNVPVGKKWSGILTIVKLKAIADGDTMLTLTKEVI